MLRRLGYVNVESIKSESLEPEDGKSLTHVDTKMLTADSTVSALSASY